ncbi:MAG: hypothetical protein WA949_08630 [Phormidesmis sp.]
MLGDLTQNSADTDPSVLIPWLKKILLSDKDTFETAIRIKLRGNILHVLCDSAKQRHVREVMALRLVRSLLQPSAKARFESDFSHIYQIYLYSRESSSAKPAWSVPIYLNRLERHLERLEQRAEQREKNQVGKPTEADLAIAQSEKSVRNQSPEQASTKQTQPEQTQPKPAPSEQLPSVSILTLARQGDSDAIAQYLGEALSALNVGVKVSARVLSDKADEFDTDEQAEPSEVDQPLAQRLWILCEASYSPDPLIIAEPLAQRLRQLRLRQFQDAVITIQVTGEAASDWRLRVDLTPPEEMLNLWGQWGDLPAISRLVNQLSKSYGLKLIAEVKKDTLHLISYPVSPVDGKTGTPLAPSADEYRQEIDVDGLVTAIGDRLRAIAPQGLQRAMLYGPSTDDISPEWLKSIDLPALNRLELQKTARELATEGDIEALSYCLTRALNLDIREQLATGGIRVQVLNKDKLLHIMADGPICPPKAVIVPLINQLLKQIRPADLDGVRLYGRRAGQKQPIWSYGHDYRVRERLVPEATAEFAASDAYAGELITSVSDESLGEDTAAVDEADIKFGSVIKRAVQRLLLKSQVFTPLDEGDNLPVNLPSAFQSDGGKMALFWGAAGLLLAAQFDFLVGQALQQAAAPISAAESQAAGDVGRVRPSEFDDELSRLNWQRSSEAGEQWNRQTSEGFFGSSRVGGSDFTSSAIDDSELLYSPKQSVVESESLLASSALPSFRSRQLDEKLALYRRIVEQSGPPDVLVIGSSRALRGIDPVALQKSLDASGHKNLSVFNFGVNGATAQVVDLVVQRLIAPNQLPQMIIWADGARAFNSGRTDVTFNAIAVSEGYHQLEASDPVNGVDGLAAGSLADQLTVRATETDRELSETFGQVSSAYLNRDKVRSALGQGLGAIFPREGFSLTEPFRSATATEPSERSDLELADSEFVDQNDAGDSSRLTKETSLIDYDGFLPLPNRFNPATYYQDHPRVAGDYDGDYEAFRLDGEQSEALRNMLRFTAEKEIPVIFVNTPLTDEYLDSYRDRAEDTFTQYMLQVAERYPDFTFRDLGQLWPQQYDYFSDPSHLNRYGAYQVSQRLSQDPLIPWPQASASTSSLLSR